jgi:hypothetical protein
MIAKFVKAMIFSLMGIATSLLLPSSAWSQSCSTTDTGASISCSAQGAQCSNTAETGKPPSRGTCKTIAKANGDSACSCVDGKAGILSSGAHSLALRAKGGGGGAVASGTFFGLVGLWCLVAIWPSRKSTSA